MIITINYIASLKMESLNKPWITFLSHKSKYILPAWKPSHVFSLQLLMHQKELVAIYIVVTIFIVVMLMLKYNELKMIQLLSIFKTWLQ